jgi:hypothetical protein
MPVDKSATMMREDTDEKVQDQNICQHSIFTRDGRADKVGILRCYLYLRQRSVDWQDEL